MLKGGLYKHKIIAMKKIKLLSGFTLLLSMITVSVFAQFDDLYYDESSYEDSDVYDYDDDSYDDEIAYQEESTDLSDYDLDEYDEYTEYNSYNYEIDAYQYTNRLDRYRLAVFASNYYGQNFYFTNGNSFYRELNRRINNDRFFAAYLRNALIFGPSYGQLYTTFGPYRDPFSPFYSPFSRTGRNFGWAGSGFGGGFARGIGGGAYYCPPYGATNITNIFPNYNPGSSSVNRSRTTNSTTRSNANTSRTVYGKVASRGNIRPSSSTRTVTRSTTRTATPSSRSVRSNSTNTSSRSVRSTRTTNRSNYGNSRSTRSTRSYAPTRSSSTRSSGVSRSSGTRSVSRSSGSTSTRSVRRP